MSEALEGNFSLEAEQSVIGGLLLENDAWEKIADAVTERDFYAPDHRKVFRAISRLLEQGKAADVVTVAEFLESHHELENVGGLPHLVKLAQNTPSAANIRRYAEIVRERAVLRKLGGALLEAQDALAARNGRSARELLEFTAARVSAVEASIQKGGAGAQHVGLVMDAVLRHIDELSQRKGNSDITGLATGFLDLDKATTGLHPGELVILAARPAMGKTAFSMNIAEHVALAGKNVAFFSLEMSREQLGVRLLASAARLHTQRVKVGRLNKDEFERMYESSNKLRDAALFIDEEGAMTINDLRTRIRRLHRECGGLHLVVIDYLQLMDGQGKTDNRAYELAEISRALKLLAKELGLPILALSQLNRGLESRPNKRPVMSDLKDSGGIEQDADIILMIYRDEVYNEDSPDKGIAEIIIGKQRNGPTGTIYTGFRGEFTRFENRHPGAAIPSHAMRQERREKRRGSAYSYRDRDDGHVPM